MLIFSQTSIMFWIIVQFFYIWLTTKNPGSMKKNYTHSFMVLLLFVAFQKMKGQMVIPYLFSQSASTYSAITGGTVLGSSINDDDVFDYVPIGFTFNYGNVNFTEVSVCANGYLKLGSVANNQTFFYQPISDVFADDTIVSALGSDIESNPTGVLQYKTIGTAPNRVFVVQWDDYTSYGNFDVLNFQIRFHETTNVIDVYYGSCTIDAYGVYEVGLRGVLSNSDYNNRSVLNFVDTWATSTPGASAGDYCELDLLPQFVPVNGQKYTWSPPAPCVGTPNAGTTTATSTLACVGQTVGLGLVGTTVASGLTFQWQSSPNAVSWTNVTSATSPNYVATFASAIYYRCIVACTSNTAASVPVQLQAQTANVYATVPFLENFDNTWQNRCDLRNVPVSANWNSFPTTGDDSWRRQDDGISANWSSGNGVVMPFDGIGSADFNTYDAPNGNTGQLDLYVNLGTTQNYQLSFYHTNYSGDDSLEVFLSTDGGNTFTKKAGFISGDYSVIDQNWNKKIVNLGAVNSPTCVLRFLATSDFGVDDIGMDSLQIKTFTCTVPTMSIAASQATSCAGAPVTLTVTGATTYTWNTNANTNTITVTPSATTIYTVTGESSPGCQSIKTITVNVTPGPSITFSASPGLTICPGGAANITAMGATNYTWSVGSQTTAAISVSPSISQAYNITGTNASGCSTTTNVTVFVASCTGLTNQAVTASNINIYPNPTKGALVIELNNATNNNIQVLDVTGRLILEKNATADRTELNISDLSNGIYYVRILSGNTVEVRKIIKE